MNMNKGLVIYKSKYGATKKYADMLKAELSCEIYESGNCKMVELTSYDWIIFAGGIYASGILGLDVLKKNYKLLKNRKVAVFCVGASPFDERALAEIKAHNLKEELKDVPVFYGRGEWDESKMNWIDRTMCKMLQKAIAKKDVDLYEPWMKALLSAVGQKCDWTDRKYLIPLLEYISAET